MEGKPLNLPATALLTLVCAVSLHAQLPTLADIDHSSTAPAKGPLPAWDAAVIKPHPAGERMMSWQMNADGMRLINLPLEQMICNAWDVKPYQV
jgi:hypothetical protein